MRSCKRRCVCMCMHCCSARKFMHFVPLLDIQRLLRRPSEVLLRSLRGTSREQERQRGRLYATVRACMLRKGQRAKEGKESPFEYTYGELSSASLMFIYTPLINLLSLSLPSIFSYISSFYYLIFSSFFILFFSLDA
jgi:hypothetical protein